MSLKFLYFILMEINNIFLKNNCDNEDLKYQTTSDYSSSDEKNKKSNNETIKLNNIKKEDKKIIINKRSLFLIKYTR
jgi:hypothetical protein